MQQTISGKIIRPGTLPMAANTVSTLPAADSSNYGEFFLKSVSGTRDTLWLSMLDSTGTNRMANIVLGSYALDFDPLTDVSGCLFWVAADKLTGYSDGDSVTTVPDYSTTGLSFTDGSSLGGLTYVANAYNGLPCLRNVGGTQFLYDLAVPSGITSSSNVTAFFVMKHGGNSSDTYCPLIVGSNGYGGHNDGVIPLFINPGDVYSSHPGCGTGEWTGLAPGSSSIHLYTVLDMFSATNGAELLIDGVSKGTTNLTPRSDVNTPTQITGLFGTTPTNPSAQMDLCEGILYAGDLSTTDYGKVGSYLLGKWGLV